MANEFKKNFGKRVKHYRELLGYTQETLAEKVGIAPNTLSYIERGKNSISFSRLQILSSALEVEPYQLFLDTDNNDCSKIDAINKLIKKATNKQLGVIYNVINNILDL